MQFQLYDESTVVHLCECKSDVVVAADLDFTLIKPMQRRKFPRDTSDMILMPGVIDALQKINDSGARLVVFTNQKGKTFDYVSERCTEFINLVRKTIDNFDCDIFAATRNDKYRKPFTGMYDLFKSLSNCTAVVYAGDALMRAGDFSASDAAFAYNCNMQLISEKTFTCISTLNSVTIDSLKTLQTHPTTPSTPADMISQCEVRELTNEVLGIIPGDVQKRCFIMIGAPCSGKSTAAAKIKTKFTMAGRTVSIINMDTLKTEKKCLVAFTDAFANDVIVVDNCNASKKQRNKYTDILPDDYTITYVVMKTPQCVIEVLNKIRNITECKSIPTVAYRMFHRNYEPLELDEPSIECFELNTVPNEWWHNMWIC